MAVMTQIPSLNGFRALSILIVLGSHLAFSQTAPAIFAPFLHLFDGGLVNGALGVRIFFCISGFLITTLLLAELRANGAICLSRFYARRALRIIPVSYAYIFVLFVLTQTTALVVTPCEFATALSYTKNYACSSWIDGHLWSLSVEEQFYLIWPLTLNLSRPMARTLAVAAIFGAPPSRMIEYYVGHSGVVWLPSHADALMMGSLSALALDDGRERVLALLRWKTPLLRAAAALALCLPVVALNAGVTESAAMWIKIAGPSLQAAAATYLICSYACVAQGPIFRLLNTPVVVRAGVLSYSLYVWQQLYFTNPEDFGFIHPAAMAWPFNVAMIFLTAGASYVCFEQPLLALRRRFAPKA